MMILVPIPVYHDITGKEENVTIGLIPIDLVTIKSIIEEPETGFATIHYKSSEELETRMPFIELFAMFNSQGIVDGVGLKRCLEVSKPLKDYITELDYPKHTQQ